MQSQPARTDAENRRLLEQVIPTYERLKTERIRNEGEVERCEKALADALEAARQELGTDDAAELQKMVEEAQAQSSTATDLFVEAVRLVDSGVRQVGGN
jgi:hypothetical protein